MKYRMVLILAAVVLMGVLAGPTFAAGARHAPHKAVGAATKVETFVIVQVGDEVKVVPKSGLIELQRTINDTFKQDTKTYQEAKKEATKNKEKFDQPKPVKPVVKKLKEGIKNEQEANQEAAKFQDKLASQKKDHPSTKPVKTQQP
ncbi:MAG: hypothetical protein ABFC77_07845 [Thermoguttaceae bacterium]